jgi:hypothetical protein
MKALLFKSIIVLFVLSSCSTGKSFMHQRYTSLGHKKHHSETPAKPTYANLKKEVKAVEEPVLVNVPAAEPQMSPVKDEARLTASAANTSSLKRKPITGLTENNFVNSAVKTIKKAGATKVFNKDKQAKHGLLFGVIDALLSIVLIVLFIAVVVFVIAILL